MDDPVRKITKLQILSYIDDFIQNNVKVLENPCYTDIGEYHKLMKKIKSKMIYSHEGCGTKTSKRRKSSVEVSVKDSVLNTIDNSLSEVSCTSDCTSKDMNLSTKNKVVLNCGISKPIVIKEELPEIKTEVFEFNPREHGIYASESFSPTCIEVKSDNSHNIILYELHNDNNLLQIINNDNDTKPDRNMMILQKLLSKNSLNVAVDCGNNNINNSGIKVDTPFIKEDIVLSDYEPAEIKNDDYYNTIIKNEPTQLKVRTDLVQQLQLEQNSSNGIVNMENTAAFIGTDACKSISNKSGSTLSNENSKKQGQH
ncbi:uncharacterized protein LOC108741132 isoform X2 [Agrilus planipennis]|uniref:Uncharacterized protein LOC108741132 isoform X2 n=1 Tax=Agrilus planipennis TaxID=224129 RepID=A0A1W4XG27_AGRPL|nr:uncharacterized protein LOC108741132 isoform X2 [Agrilus planipennis]